MVVAHAAPVNGYTLGIPAYGSAIVMIAEAGLKGLTVSIRPRKVHRRSDPSTWPDDRLLEACARGEHEAWREIVSRYGRLVYAIPRTLGLQAADAEEVFQYTFSELLLWVSRLRDPYRLESWLATTARRASVRLIRLERRRRTIAEQSAAAHEPAHLAADAEVERVREGEWLRRALEALGDPCRTLLIGLFSEPARSYRDLARELGLAVGSLGSLRSRCVERLRTRLRRSGMMRERATSMSSAGPGRPS